VFGLGSSHYDPRTNLVVVSALSTDEAIRSVRPEDPSWVFSKVATHEVGHHVLAACTRMGRVLRDIASLMQGLCLVIAERMLEEHGQVWQPISSYLGVRDSSPRIEAIVRAALRLDALSEELTGGWRITQELFASAWSVLFQSILQYSVSSATGTSTEDVQSRIAVASRAADPATMKAVQRRIESYCLAREIQWSALSEEDKASHLRSMAQKARAAGEDDIAISVLELLAECRERRDGAEEPQFDEFIKSVESDLCTCVGSGQTEALRAWEAYFRAVDEVWPWSILGLMMDVALASAVFTPRFSVDRLLDETCAISVGRIDAGVLVLAHSPLWKRVFSEHPSASEFFDAVESIQMAMGSLRLSQIRRVPYDQIVGTRDWIAKLVGALRLRRSERRMINGLLETGTVAMWYGERPTVEQDWRLLPWPCHVIGRAAFLFREPLERRSTSAQKLFKVLREVGIRTWADVRALWNLYHDVLGVVELGSGESWLTPLVQVGIDRTGLVLVPGRHDHCDSLRVWFFRYLLGMFAESLLKGRASTPLVCAGCHIQGLAFGSDCPDRCAVGRIAEGLLGEGDVLVCCAGREARFILLGDASASQRSVVTPFLLKEHPPADADHHQPEEATAGSRESLGSFTRAAHWLRAYPKQRRLRRPLKSVDRMLRDLPMRLVRLASLLAPVSSD